MSMRIEDHFMALEMGGEIIATARFRQHAAADSNGAWLVSTQPGRLFRRDGAITALTLAERLAVVGYGDDDPFVACWREELFRRPGD
jgi:hypothetical protein